MPREGDGLALRVLRRNLGRPRDPARRRRKQRPREPRGRTRLLQQRPQPTAQHCAPRPTTTPTPNPRHLVNLRRTRVVRIDPIVSCTAPPLAPTVGRRHDQPEPSQTPRNRGGSAHDGPRPEGRQALPRLLRADGRGCEGPVGVPEARGAGETMSASPATAGSSTCRSPLVVSPGLATDPGVCFDRGLFFGWRQRTLRAAVKSLPRVPFVSGDDPGMAACACVAGCGRSLALPSLRRAADHGPQPAVCLHCRTPFTATRVSVKFCSSNCRAAAWRMQRAAAARSDLLKARRDSPQLCLAGEVREGAQFLR